MNTCVDRHLLGARFQSVLRCARGKFLYQQLSLAYVKTLVPSVKPYPNAVLRLVR